MEILIKLLRLVADFHQISLTNRISPPSYKTYLSPNLTNLKHTEDDTLRFSEAVCDFGSLIIEHGADKVLKALKDGYPQQAVELLESYSKPQIPALFKP